MQKSGGLIVGAGAALVAAVGGVLWWWRGRSTGEVRAGVRPPRPDPGPPLPDPGPPLPDPQGGQAVPKPKRQRRGMYAFATPTEAGLVATLNPKTARTPGAFYNAREAQYAVLVKTAKGYGPPTSSPRNPRSNSYVAKKAWINWRTILGMRMTILNKAQRGKMGCNGAEERPSLRFNDSDLQSIWDRLRHLDPPPNTSGIQSAGTRYGVYMGWLSKKLPAEIDTAGWGVLVAVDDALRTGAYTFVCEEMGG